MATEWVVQAAGLSPSWVIATSESATPGSETAGSRIILEGGGGFLLLETGGYILLESDDDPGDVADPIPTWTPQGAASPTWTEQA